MVAAAPNDLDGQFVPDLVPLAVTRSATAATAARTAETWLLREVKVGATALATGLPGLDNNGWTYDPVIDRLWAVDYGGTIYQYNPATFARTTFATGTGSHTCMAYVP